jgi:serine/threonine-protein kinase
VENILARFEREAKSLARLSHPNIVKVHDFGEYEGAPFLVMEYLSGGTLKSRLGEAIPWAEAARGLLPVARGLAYAHARGIIHRDVKPANILISEEAEPLLSDFGIAKLLENEEGRTLTGSGVGIGTPEYMAPEQAIGQAVDARVDIYSLGIVLYEMITGRKPYTADTPMAVVLKQISDPLPRPSSFVADLPEAVEHVLIKALAKHPEDRYETMGAFCKALEALLTSPLPDIKPVAAVPEAKAAEEVIASTPPATTLLSSVETINNLMAASPSANKLPVAQPASRSPGNLGRWIGLGVVVFGIAGIAMVILLVGWLAKAEKTNVPPASTEANTANPSRADAPPATQTLPVTKTLAATETVSASAIPKIEIGRSKLGKDGMLLLYVPAGEFRMGSENGNSDEKPVHSVTLDAYWIDQNEVTNSMYAVCLKAGICQDTGSKLITDPAYASSPVVDISWNKAKIYCEWAGRRLPSEAEWEKAARGTDERQYPWGNEDPTCDRVNFSTCSGKTDPVGSHPAGASPYGALDMAGNVWEWVADRYDGTYYQDSPASNPLGPETPEYRVLRGGSWNYYDLDVRSTRRDRYFPSFASHVTGSRCATSK